MPILKKMSPPPLPVIRPAGAALSLLLAASAAHAVDWPSGYSKCADEGETCRAGTSTRPVSFGIKDKWVIKNLSGDIACTVATFGSDPNPGITKKCAVGPVGSPAPSPAPTPAPTPAPHRRLHPLPRRRPRRPAPAAAMPAR